MSNVATIAREIRQVAESEQHGLLYVMREVERSLLYTLMQEYKGKVTEAARSIGLGRTTLCMKLVSHGIIAANFRENKNYTP